ncbi:GGDEF domain-containing protein [Hoeflea sp. AS60]|uniref:GGDEF domain-containing protein n=1 Tax=Hoeflea sp. AS60 TaxID=3135780 RepID=UPI00317D9DF7
METFTLFCANLTILLVFSGAFLVFSVSSAHQPYWRSWSLANFLLALSLGFFALESHLPVVTVFVVPNALLLLGFGVHLNAASQFAGQSAAISRLWIPVAALVVINVPAMIFDSYGIVYVSTNLLVAAMAAMTARIYAGRELGGLMSRYGLVLAFLLMAAEGAIRATHGIALGKAMGAGLSDDVVLTTHLLASLVFVTLAGAFALGIFFERTARQQHDIASRDPLTGLYNRREFDRRLEAMLSARSSASFGVLQLDLDFFKQVNDRYGHVSGDDALVAVADVIRKNLKDGDCLARLGGEEFGVLLPDVDRNGALATAERIRRVVEAMPLAFASEGFRLTVSAGLYHGTGGKLSARSLMQAVDRSLYRSKNNGRNQVSVAEAA